VQYIMRWLTLGTWASVACRDHAAALFGQRACAGTTRWTSASPRIPMARQGTVEIRPVMNIPGLPTDERA
jgi:hypothetical protein